MSNKNEIKLINACIRKNKEIKKLKNEIVALIDFFQILQKYLNFKVVFDLNNNSYIVGEFSAEINIFDFYKLKHAIERYGIK